ncbi:MAG TPA: glycosyl hydrolase family 18 protein, partial [Bacteroidota bacterium]|nr:glycosyl hydrolase family 18 protein [Bacteroidota bacterium]
YLECVGSRRTDGQFTHLNNPIMRTILHARWASLVYFLILIISGSQQSRADLPATGNNKVAYYAFDATPYNQPKLRLTDFTDNANIIVLFEGTIFELCDSLHYGSASSYIVTINGGPYKYYKQILDDVRTLRARGIKVLMNVDDTKAWSTASPFTTYDGRKLTAAQYALFIDSCITAVGLDGISLDIEHGATDNSYYRDVVRELGSYVGPLSKNSTTRIYTAAIYYSSWGIPGPSVIGLDRSMASYLNFVMDMGYFQDNTKRFKRWADSLGNAKVMNGFSHAEPNNPLSVAAAWAAWRPTPNKAGVMVFAGNVSKTYTDSIFSALSTSITDVAMNDVHSQSAPRGFALLQNYPNPFNPSTTIQYHVPRNGYVTMKVFDILGHEVATLVDGNLEQGSYSVRFDGSRFAGGMYIAKLTVRSNDAPPSITIRKMAMIK